MSFSYGRPPPKIEGMMSLKVDNLTYRTTPDDLRRVFEKYGDVGDVYIPRDRWTRESRGFAFVRFYDKRDAEDAMESLDGRVLDGRELRVQMARYGRPNSPHRSSRSRRSGSRSRRRRSRSDSRGHDKERGRDRGDRGDRDRERRRKTRSRSGSKTRKERSVSPRGRRSRSPSRPDSKERSASPAGRDTRAESKGKEESVPRDVARSRSRSKSRSRSRSS